MAEEYCNPTLDSGCDGLGRKPKRNHYFNGKQLGVEDFVTEQRYVIQKIRRLGLHLVGCGVVTGLRIEGIKEDGRVVAVTPGAAVDGCGNLLVLARKREFRLDRKIAFGEYIYLAYREEGTDKVPRERGDECSDDCCFSRIEEDVTIQIDTTLDPAVPATICEEAKRGVAGAKRGRVLLGRYLKGGPDYSDVTPLYTVGELSKRLCEIARSYVRSLNGQTGDVAAIASVNEATPDENGHLAIEEGNNISIESEGNRLTISSTGSFYHSQLMVLDAGERHTIRHGFGKIPTVDVYRAVRVHYKKDMPAYEAATVREIEKMARAADVDVETYMQRVGAARFDTHMESFNAEHPSMKKRVYSTRSKTLTATALSRYGVTDFSPKVERVAAYPLERVAKDLVILPRYHYEKIVGGDESMRITVRHTGTGSVVITNSDPERQVTLFVVLSA
ncbi:hypothetical protein [Hydrogenimonas sp.]